MYSFVHVVSVYERDCVFVYFVIKFVCCVQLSFSPIRKTYFAFELNLKFRCFVDLLCLGNNVKKNYFAWSEKTGKNEIVMDGGVKYN